ncbi:MAG: hypothetical protein ACKPGH_11495, partial [Dolichospermum sp.]
MTHFNQVIDHDKIYTAKGCLSWSSISRNSVDPRTKSSQKSQKTGFFSQLIIKSNKVDKDGLQ